MSCEDLLHFYADIANYVSGSWCSFEENARANVWQGNTTVIYLHPLIDGSPVTDLSSAINGAFQAMGHRDNEIGAALTWGDAHISVDDPEIGVIKVTLDASVTDQMYGEYDLALQVEWADVTYEWMFRKTLNIMRDQIIYTE